MKLPQWSNFLGITLSSFAAVRNGDRSTWTGKLILDSGAGESGFGVAGSSVGAGGWTMYCLAKQPVMDTVKDKTRRVFCLSYFAALLGYSCRRKGTEKRGQVFA